MNYREAAAKLREQGLTEDAPIIDVIDGFVDILWDGGERDDELYERADTWAFKFIDGVR